MLIDRVRRTIRRHDLAGPSTRVVVALSGGGDSVALAHLLRDVAARGQLAIAGVAHFNHQLRAAADADPPTRSPTPASRPGRRYSRRVWPIRVPPAS